MQMKLLLATWAAALAELLVVGVAVQLRSVQTKGGEQFFAYDYSQHGQDWVSGSCSSRTRQSPIDLPAQAPMAGTFTYKYKPVIETFDLINNGHTLSADLAGLGNGGITYNNEWYNLLNINVHSMSEHAWTGQRKPLELHMVHKHYATEALLIVAVAVESATPLPPPPTRFLQVNASTHGLRGAAQQPQQAPISATYTEPPSGDADFNPTLQAFLKMEPPAVNMKAVVPASAESAFELNPLVDGADFYEYAGSLTAPPCAEIATWLVRKDVMKASDKQVLYLHDAIFKANADFGNYRILMPLNSRAVTMRQGTLEDPPKAARADVSMPGNPQQTDREFRAMKWAMDAMTIAKGSVNYIKDLDQRMRNAAQAHADALAPGLEPLNIDGKLMGPGGTPGVGAPPPPVMQVAPPIPMENVAQAMTAALAEAARAEVEDASKQITEQSKVLAIQAAREAAQMVASGPLSGNGMAMANTVVAPPPAR